MKEREGHTPTSIIFFFLFLTSFFPDARTFFFLFVFQKEKKGKKSWLISTLEALVCARTLRARLFRGGKVVELVCFLLFPLCTRKWDDCIPCGTDCKLMLSTTFVVFFFPSLCVVMRWQVKLEPRSPAKPSRVVHIRNIPNDVTEAEIVHLGIPFGRVTNVLVLKGKNQVRGVRDAFFFLFSSCRGRLLMDHPPWGSSSLFHMRFVFLCLNPIRYFFLQSFLEMADEGAAISMVNYFSSGTSAQLRGRNVFVQYSNHVALKTDQSHSNAVRFYYKISLWCFSFFFKFSSLV